MEAACGRLVSANSGANGTVSMLRGMNWKCRSCSRTISTSNFLQASKPKKLPAHRTAPVPKKKLGGHSTAQNNAPKKPLEYKTPTRKPLPNTSSSLPPPPSRPNLLRHRKIPLVLGGITLFAFSSYTTYLIINLSRTPSTPAPSAPSSQADVSSRYNTIASSFDSTVDWNEKLMRLPSLRRKLVSQAHGDVLEVSVGTGRNLEYYDWDFKGYNGVGKPARDGGIKRGKVRSLTAIDKSGEMLQVAHEKFSAMFPGIVGVRWIVGDAGEEIPAPPKNVNERSGVLVGKKYDTIVQTMGLCSVGDPVGLLKNLGSAVKEEDGRILLLEHGRGNWEWLNAILDRFAEGHAKEFGCWWNRDLGEIVKESGLEVVKEDRIWWHGGTTWWIELKKPRGPLEETPASREVVKEVEKKEGAKKGSWLWKTASY